MHLTLGSIAAACLFLLAGAIPNPQAGQRPGQCVAGRYYGTMRTASQSETDGPPRAALVSAELPPRNEPGLQQQPVNGQSQAGFDLQSFKPQSQPVVKPKTGKLSQSATEPGQRVGNELLNKAQPRTGDQPSAGSQGRFDSQQRTEPQSSPDSSGYGQRLNRIQRVNNIRKKPTAGSVVEASSKQPGTSLVKRAPQYTPDINGGCGPIGRYLSREPTSADWINSKTKEWFEQWWRINLPSFSNEPGGFVGVFRRQFLGEPGSQCKIGSVELCTFDPCGNPRLNAINECDLQPAYLVLQAMKGLKNYFSTINDAMRDAFAGAGLVKDNFALTFYKDPVFLDGGAFSAQLTIANFLVAMLGPLGPVLKSIKAFAKIPEPFFFLPPVLMGNFQVFFLSGLKSPYVRSRTETASHFCSRGVSSAFPCLLTLEQGGSDTPDRSRPRRVRAEWVHKGQGPLREGS